ncbi:UNVERIFIED_CONTAM: hypothetical protein GTU68_049888 [Idotea baltica]|nr:hypothetical protein [Idotea baltica]
MTSSSDCHSLRVVFAGTPDFAASALQALLDSDHQVVGVLTQPDRPAGRGRALKASPVKVLAERNGVPVQQPQNFKEPESVAALQEFNCDVMVVAAYGIILPEVVLNLPRLGCLNIHASLLPRWRGAAPIQRALLSGDEESGVCIMKMDEGLDTGDVVSTAKIAITENMTGGELHDGLAELGASTLVETLTPFCRGDLTAVSQDTNGINYAAKLNKAEAALDFNEPALELHRKIQAFNPWPVCDAMLDGVRYRIWKSRLVKDVKLPATAQPGQVISVSDEGLRVATSAGAIDIIEIQKPGKKPMQAGEFSRGTDLTDKVFG